METGCTSTRVPGNPPARTREPDDGARWISSPFTGFFVCKTTMREGFGLRRPPKVYPRVSVIVCAFDASFFDPPGGCAWCWEERVCVSVLCVCGRAGSCPPRPRARRAFRLTCSACQSARGRRGRPAATCRMIHGGGTDSYAEKYRRMQGVKQSDLEKQRLLTDRSAYLSSVTA